MDEPEKPWWNDSDKVAGLAATVVLIGLAFGVAIVLFCGGIWVGSKIL